LLNSLGFVVDQIDLRALRLEILKTGKKTGLTNACLGDVRPAVLEDGSHAKPPDFFSSNILDLSCFQGLGGAGCGRHSGSVAGPPQSVLKES